MSNTASKVILPDGTEVTLTGGGDTINVDAELKEHMIWTDGIVKKCIQDTNFSPDEYPQAWEDAS